MVYKVRHPSLDLGWLQRKLRQLPTPALIFADLGEACSGFYSTRPYEYLAYGVLVPPGPVIAVNTGLEGVDLENTLAHEFRHHWQTYNGWDLYKGRERCWAELEQDLDYDGAIAQYFQIPSERDALLWAQQVARCEVGAQWMDTAGINI